MSQRTDDYGYSMLHRARTEREQPPWERTGDPRWSRLASLSPDGAVVRYVVRADSIDQWAAEFGRWADVSVGALLDVDVWGQRLSWVECVAHPSEEAALQVRLGRG